MDFASADLDALLEDGVTVTCGVDPAAKGSFRIADVEVEVEGGMTATASHPTLLMRSDRLPSAIRHATVTVAGADYIVRDSRLESNGQMKRLILVPNDA
jgi:hypothetical protein